MRKHFESGSFFIVVALLSVVAGLLQAATGHRGRGFVLLLTAGMWFLIAISRRKLANKRRNDNSDPAS